MSPGSLTLSTPYLRQQGMLQKYPIMKLPTQILSYPTYSPSPKSHIFQQKSNPPPNSHQMWSLLLPVPLAQIHVPNKTQFPPFTSPCLQHHPPGASNMKISEPPSEPPSCPPYAWNHFLTPCKRLGYSYWYPPHCQYTASPWPLLLSSNYPTITPWWEPRV